MYKSRSTTKTLEKKTLKECRNNSFCKESPFIGFSLYDPNKTDILCYLYDPKNTYFVEQLPGRLPLSIL